MITVSACLWGDGKEALPVGGVQWWCSSGLVQLENVSFFYFHAQPDNLWCKQLEFSLCTLSSSLSRGITEIQKFPYTDGVGNLTKICIASQISSFFVIIKVINRSLCEELRAWKVPSVFSEIITVVYWLLPNKSVILICRKNPLMVTKCKPSYC